jgi:integrase/recombinase XerD
MQEFKVNIYPSKDQNFVTSFIHPLTKRKVRQSFLSSSEAQDFKKTTEEKFKNNKVKSYSSLSIEELIICFLQEKPNNSFSKKSCHLIDFIETFGQFGIEDITGDALKLWLDQIQKENDLKDISMRGLKCELDSLFVFLQEKEIISESPLSQIYYKKVIVPHKARNLLTELEIDMLLKELKAYSPGYLYPIMKMFSETGAKTTEIVELTWDKVNLNDGSVRFKISMKSQERTLKISNELTKMLSMKKRNSNFVFQTYYKENFTNSKLIRAINEFKLKGNYKGEWCPMDLRHSFAVNFLVNGGNLKELQQILGHDNVYDTKRLYGEALEKRTHKNVTNPFE